jgi:uncharacterized protein with NAD-binding domain and iron-sulfur cluster
MTRPERIRERFPLLQDPPFSLKGTRAFLFLLPADPAKLDALLARTFAWGAPEVNVSRLGSHVLLAITDTAEASAADPHLGHFAYQEATFFVPVQGTQHGTPFVGLHVPFIYPSEGLAVAAGREIYGLPKKPATLTVPSDGDFWGGTAPIGARCLAAERFDGSAWQDEALFSISATAQSPAAELADTMLDAVDGFFGPLPGHLFGQDLVQLKQVADVETGGIPPRVLYRAITHVKAPVDNVTNVRVGDASKVTVHFETLASEPIRDVLGLAEDVTPVLATSFEMDFGFTGGEVWLERPEPPPAPPPKEKVLILGGGLGALATAFELTATEERRQKYDVRILAQGHLLGGKGASWRNRAKADRIEEHGLHVIFGFYHNFLRMFREVYAEAARPDHVDPSSFAEAFHPEDVVVFHNGSEAWPVRFPRTPSGYGAGPKTLWQQVQWLQMLAQSVLGGGFAGLVSNALLPWGNQVVKEIAVFVATLAKGVADDIILGGKDWEDLDHLDFRDWMESHKVVPGFDIANSAIMQVPYDGVFAYEGPDQSAPKLSATIAARGLLKLVTDYQRAVFFEMTTGMGEAVFAPMYEVLKARGVTIELFAKVKDATMTGGSVDTVSYARQATVLAGDDSYDPIEMVGTVPCFRQHPDPAQLDPASPALAEDPYADSSTAQVGPDRVLTVGTDFDWVVCALPAPVTARVFTAAPASSALAKVGAIPTVATLHLQTWMDDHRHINGWHWNASVLGGFEQPLNSMQENTRLLGVETWPMSGPKSLLYCSGPFGGGWSTDPEDPAARTAARSAALAEAKTFAENELPKVFPAAVDSGTGKLDLDRLHAPWTPADPFADQYVTGNIDRSARYVLCVPGGLADRPEPEGEPSTNLKLAGDWTKNGIDIPSMEGTCVSAIRAAASIMGIDPPILE